MSEMLPEGYQLDPDRVQKALFKGRLQQLSRKKRLFISAGLLIALAAVGIGLYCWQHTANKGDGFLTAAVHRATITDYIEATGTLEPIKRSALGFKTDGTITRLTPQPGDRVQEGQVLAQQDPTTLKLALEQANNALLQDEISLETVLLNRDSSRKALEQQENLFQAGVSAEAELNAAQNNYQRSELEVKTAQARLANDRAKVDQALSNLNDATLVAPFDGIVGAVNGQVGQINGINASSSTLLTIISEDLQLNALVNEADIGRVKAGQPVEFTSNAYSDKVFQGRVLRITPEAQSVSNVQYYPVLISCTDPEKQLYSGMSVSAQIIVTREEDVLTIPMMAVSFAENFVRSHPGAGEGTPTSRPGTGTGDRTARSGPTPGGATEEGQPGTVLLLEGDQPVIRNVLLGVSNGSLYRIVEGLEEGQRVIIGSNQMNAGSAASGDNSRSGGSSQGWQNRRSGVTVMRPPGF